MPMTAPLRNFAGRRSIFSGVHGGGLFSGLALPNSDKTLFLPGAAGDFVSTPDAAALDIVGDIDLRLDMALTDWTPGTVASCLVKFLTTGNQRSYGLNISTTGLIQMVWSADGTAVLTRSSTVSTSTVVADGNRIWVRATLDVDNGAAGHDAMFFTSIDGGATWVQLGATVTTAGVTSIFSGSAVLQVSNFDAGAGSQPMAGRCFRAQVRNGINGTLVADMNPPDWGSGTTWTSAATGEVWTLNGAARIALR